MATSFKKSRKLLNDHSLLKRDFCEIAGVLIATMAKLGKNVNVIKESLAKICRALACNISDIVEFEERPTGSKEKQI